MGRKAVSSETVVVERADQIDALCDEARAAGRFAFDTEFVMEDRYEAEVCLVQVATEQSVAIIDPFLDLDLDPIWTLVADPAVETVVHAGQEDLGMCVQHIGQVPRNVFDTQIGSGLVGFEYPMSLQKLVQALLHVRLHKAKTLTDWRRRPLSPAQIRYGVEDVSYLLAVHTKLRDRLAKKGRSDWATEEFRHFEEMTLYRRADEEKLWRIKGAGSLEGRQLAVLHALLPWRDNLAQQLNRPARVVLKDFLMVEIAKLGLGTHAEVRDLRGINLSDRHVNDLCRVVQAALATPPETWPVAKDRDFETPRETVLVDLATALIRAYCLEHDLSYSLVATKKSIRDLIRHRTQGRPEDTSEIELLTGWRGHTVGAMIDELLEGRRTVRVRPVDGELTVEFA